MCMSLIKLLTHFSTLWNRVQGSEQTKSDYELLYRTTDLVSAGRKDRSTCCRISSVQSLTCVWLFATPWIAARQASLSITNSWSSPRLMCIELVLPSSHLILCRPFLLLPPILPSIRVFPVSQLFAWGGRSIGVSASASFLPMNTQDWSHLGWTGRISLQSKGLSRVFFNTTIQKHQFFSAQLSSQTNSHIHAWPLEKNHSFN